MGHHHRLLLAAAGTPASMQELFDRRKENLIREQTDNHDHRHDADDLFHGLLFASIVQELAETKSGENGYENFCSHQRSPGKSPPLFHATNNERQSSRQDNFEPEMHVL